MRSTVASRDYSVHILFLSTLALLTSGCADASASRDLAQKGAELTDTYKTETQVFFQAQDNMVQALLQTSASRRRSAAAIETQTRVQRAAWQASNDTGAARIYDSLLNPTPQS